MSDWIDNAQKAGNFAFAIASASGKADILTEQGHLREALKTYQQSLQLASEHEAESQRIIAHHHLGLALLYYEMRDDESAAQYFQQSLELGQQSVLQDWTYRTQDSVVWARSRFTVGLDWLNATINSGPVPSGQYFSWLGQFQGLLRFEEYAGTQLLGNP